jgi:alkanesulfonate monooxygenase SsuD/methylene tetrahydromethanopterin reductase-like flavin-dependent oxidoreductase (luciferase family)
MRMSIFSVQDHHLSGPRTVPELYAEIIAQVELAERLGYDTFWVAEHHFHEAAFSGDDADRGRGSS